jgi:hypothetical protein
MDAEGAVVARFERRQTHIPGDPLWWPV